MEKLNLFKDKSGQMSGPLGTVTGIVFALFLIGILVFAFALAGGQMIASTTDAAAIDVINKTVEGASQFASFSPTLWIMAGVAALLVIVLVAVGGYFMRG